jgi:hypothetical protein
MMLNLVVALLVSIFCFVRGAIDLRPSSTSALIAAKLMEQRNAIIAKYNPASAFR